MSPLLLAFLLTTFAGLSTGIGSALAFFARRTSHRFLSVATGFSAGVMLFVSFTELLQQSHAALGAAFGPRIGSWAAAGSFFGGVLFILLIDRLVPAAENPHETRAQDQVSDVRAARPAPHLATPDRHLLRVGLLTALAIGIHNFPEGLATFIAALQDPGLGAAIAVAIALHNIPEGISVAVPIFYATGNRRSAFALSFISGLAEPAGAAIGFLVLRPFMSPAVMGGIFGGIAGIMVYISLDELLPTSRAFGKGHDSLYGLLAGMVVMSLSLLLMQ